MEINDPNPLTGLNNSVQSKETSKQSERNPKCGNEQPALGRQNLSIGDREISNLDELIRSAPDVREGRIEELRKKIQRDTYNIKAEEIAEKIIKGNPLDEIT